MTNLYTFAFKKKFNILSNEKHDEGFYMRKDNKIEISL